MSLTPRLPKPLNSLRMKIHFKIRGKQLMTANAVHRQLECRFVFNVVGLNVQFEVLNVVDRLRTVETLSGDDFAVLQLVLGQNCEGNR